MSSSQWIGKSLGGRYQIEALLGQGGMSAVYKASDPNLRRTVAVKLIHPHLAEDPEFVRRFQEEASVIAQLRHPNIVQVFDFNRDGDEFYMVMEFVAGETLQDRLSRLNNASSLMPLAKVLRYAIDVCDAADYAHRHSLIHRDIKPANVMLDTEDQAILMDFGIVKIIGGPQYTATGATIGTALYMPPEQIRGEQVDKRSDVYSIGVMLYEMVAGQPPFQAPSPMTLLMMHINDPVPDVSRARPDCPIDLKVAIERAMAKDPAKRFQSAAEMSAALGQVLAMLQRSHQARTAVGGEAMAAPDRARTTDQARATGQARVTDPARATDMARTARPKTAPDSAGSAAGQAAGSDVTARPRSQMASASAATAAPRTPPPAVHQPPEAVSGGRSSTKLLITCGLLLFVALLLIGGGLVTFFVLNQRSGDDGDALAQDNVTEAPTLAVAAIESPTPEPLPSPTPALVETQTVEEPPAVPTDTPESSPTPLPRRVGLMEFFDNDQARAGSFQLSIGEVAFPANNSHYELWLDDGESLVSFGALETDGGMSLSVDGGENLLATYDGATITLEPDDGPGEEPVGDPVFVGSIPPVSLEHIRKLVASAPDSPGQKAYLVGAEEQALLAIQHSGFLSDALAAGDLGTAEQHAEHVINILSGEGNSAFGDWTNDGVAQNPGDGFGVETYLEKAAENAQSAAEADGATEEVTLHAEHMIISANNALASLEDAIQAAGRVLAADSLDEAQPSADLLAEILQVLLNGTDANGDAVIAPSPGEGGLLLAYEHALKMASFEFFLAEDVASRTEQ